MEGKNSCAALAKKLQRLQRKNKELVRDIHYMDRLFKMIGFPHGVQSLKQSAEEMNLENNQN